MAIGGLVVPIALALIATMLTNVLHPSEGYFIPCAALMVLLELAALGCGIVGRRSTSGKAGLVASVVSLALIGLAVMFLVGFSKGHDQMSPVHDKAVVKGDLPYMPVFGGPDWQSLGDQKVWFSAGDYNYYPKEKSFLLFPNCNIDSKEKLPRNFHLRMEVILFYGQGTLRFHAQPRVLPSDPPLPTDSWFLNFAEDAVGAVDAELVAKIPAHPNEIKSAHAPGIGRRSEYFYVEILAKDVRCISAKDFISHSYQLALPYRRATSVEENPKGIEP